MPSAINEGHDVPQVSAIAELLREQLDHAQVVKTTSSIDPPLSKSDFEEVFTRLATIFPTPEPDASTENKGNQTRTRQLAMIETAARDVFSNLIATTSIDSPEFVHVWNLFDILSILSDNDACDPALLLWLVEELLDSQTIEGCRKVFDFLESRRERITAKNLQQKKLIILRSCNDLLRRLSRAKDTAFCGRVFIFMFQSFPLGDRSSVNLRGEYHVENVTSYEEPEQVVPAEATDQMEVDSSRPSGTKDDKDQKVTTKAVSFDARDKATEKKVDAGALYPVFWSLQKCFSQPTKLFDTSQFTQFKSGLESTVVAFESIIPEPRSSRLTDETKLVGVKRKQPSDEGGSFNPKYLTSRDLFELEISDPTFRRNILFQAMIVIDFILSLTPQGKTKIANIEQPNKSVLYADQVLSDDDTKWAKTMKDRIANYIKIGVEGPYFLRMIESILSRDKGWVRWKIENCYPIERPALSSEEFNESKASAKRIATSKKLRPVPMGAMNLDFLKEEDHDTAMEKLKDPSRWELPDVKTFKAPIEGDDFDFDMASSEKEKQTILEAKASKTWRAMRLARRNKLALFDKVEDWQNIGILFQDVADIEDDPEDAEGPTGRVPDDKTPIILSGPPGAGKSSLVALLLQRQPGVFGKMLRHTNRAPTEGEVNGEDFHFVDKTAFNMMLDGDQFLEFADEGDVSYGTNRRTADGMIEKGKVPIIRLDRQATEFAKDMAYEARVVFISPPSIEELEARLKEASGWTEERASTAIKAAEEELEKSKTGDFYDSVIVNDDLEEAYKALETFIYGSAGETNGVNGSQAEDVAMADASNGDAEAGEPAETQETQIGQEA